MISDPAVGLKGRPQHRSPRPGWLPIGRVSYIAPHLVLDESGDPGFKLKRGQTAYLSPAFRDPEQVHAAQAYEFKFSSSSTHVGTKYWTPLIAFIRFGASAMVAKKELVSLQSDHVPGTGTQT
jgi:hypothetical protein